ncbi:hypothetical protein HKCCE2091_16615 [Rhodobacterales bacterium HKCCE2091]|nr:hypothetical protein [Rhodobacterales bacterium HKCCE2091]
MTRKAKAMPDPADSRFFRALQVACKGVDGLGDECRAAIDTAAETGDPLDMREARLCLDALDDGVRDAILHRTHQAMATDLSAIWDMMGTAPGRQRPN